MGFFNMPAVENLTREPAKPTLAAGSASRLKNYETCPYRAFLLYVEKAKEVENTAGLRGQEIHTALENYVTGKTDTIPDEINFPHEQFEQLRLHKAVCEEEWAFDGAWKPVSWFDKRVFYRAKLDAYEIVNDMIRIIDYKTGKKRRVPHTDQGMQYAVCAFKKFPHLQRADISFWYVDNDDTLNLSTDRAGVDKHTAMLNRRLMKMTTDKAFAPRPSKFNCGYCGVREHCEWRE